MVRRVLTGSGGFPRRSGLAVAGVVLGLVALGVLFAGLFSGVGAVPFALAVCLPAAGSAVCALLALFRDWGRARVGVALVLSADVLAGLLVVAMILQVEPAAPAASGALVVIVITALLGAVLVMSAPRRGTSTTPRAVEPAWAGAAQPPGTPHGPGA